MQELFLARKTGNKIIAAPIICHDEGSHIRLVKPYAGVTTFEVRHIGEPRAVSIAHTAHEAKKLVMTYYEAQVAQLRAEHMEYSQEWIGLEESIELFKSRGFRHVVINNIVFDHHPAVQMKLSPSTLERTEKNTYFAVGRDYREACEELTRVLKEAKVW